MSPYLQFCFYFNPSNSLIFQSPTISPPAPTPTGHRQSLLRPRPPPPSPIFPPTLTPTPTADLSSDPHPYHFGLPSHSPHCHLLTSWNMAVLSSMAATRVSRRSRTIIDDGGAERNLRSHRLGVSEVEISLCCFILLAFEIILGAACVWVWSLPFFTPKKVSASPISGLGWSSVLFFFSFEKLGEALVLISQSNKEVSMMLSLFVQIIVHF